MSWASLLKAGGKAVTWAGKNAGKALLHPQQTLKGAGTALKTAAVGGGLGYVGWKKLTTDESVVGIVSDAIIGEKATQKVSDTVSGAGGQMLGGFLQNLTHGNVSGMGVMGLVLSSFLVFGRFGWMARIAGAVLAMMTIGNNSRRELSPAPSIQAGTARTEQAEKQMQLPEPPQEAEQIHRRR